MFGSKARLALAIALSLTFVAACASSRVNDTAPSSGGTSSGGTSSGGTSSGDTSGGGTSSSGTSNTGDSAGASDAGANGTPTEPPYANVTAVTANGTAGAYTFNVTIESADIDCSQYADWWEVLTVNGSLVYRRILDHSHTDANGSSDADAPGNTFTRSGGPVTVADSDVVVVRAHMSVGGYNGAVMRGSVADGFAEATDLGADFAAGVELEEPQPAGCEF